MGMAISIKQAIQRLNETGEKILFIAGDNGVIKGTVTDGDIRRGILNGRQLSDPVTGIMNSDFKSVRSDNPRSHDEAMALMRRLHIDHIPALDSKGAIIDVISWIECLEDESEKSIKPAKHVAPAEDMSDYAVVIMAGGKGTRLDPFTKILPKPLIPIREKPIIEHIMDRFYKNGFNRFILVLNYKKEMIKSYFSDNKQPYTIEFVDETEFLGTAGGLSLVKDRIGKTFVVTNCDTILEGDYADFIKWHLDRHNAMTIIGSHKEIQVPYGVLQMSNGSLTDIDEKPKIDIFVNTGTYVFERGALDLIKAGERIDMDKLIAGLKSSFPDKVGVYPHWGGWFDIGQWDEYRTSLKKLGDDINGL